MSEIQEDVRTRVAEVQEEAKARAAEIQNLVRAFQDQWNKEKTEQEALERLQKEEWQKDVQAMTSLVSSCREEWTAAEKEGTLRTQHILEGLERASSETEQRLGAKAAAQEKRLQAKRQGSLKKARRRFVLDAPNDD